MHLNKEGKIHISNNNCHAISVTDTMTVKSLIVSK